MALHGEEQVVAVGDGRHEADDQTPAGQQSIFGQTLTLGDLEDFTVVGRCFIRELLLTFSLSSTTCDSAWVSRAFLSSNMYEASYIPDRSSLM